MFYHSGITGNASVRQKIISVLIAYLLGDLSAYTHWYDALSKTTTSLAGPFGIHLSFTYLSKLELLIWPW
jgi:hypothetical protein